jgi:HlyD family secretion protein
MKNKKGLLIAVLVLSALILIIILRTFLFSGGKTGNASIVDRGLVYVSVDASGIVEPENEVLILSPVSSIIKEIKKEPGSRVQKGDIMIELDDEVTRAEIEQITDQLGVKTNSLERSRLEGQMTRIDLDYNLEVKKLRIASIKAQLADEEQLLSVGGISSAKIDETKQNLVLAEKDLAMAQKKNAIRLSQLKTEETGLNLQIEIQKKQLADKIALLDQLKIKAPSDGIILAIAGKKGERIGNDKMLITLSDLTTFKIRGQIDAKSSEYVKTGNPVIIVTEKEKFNGTVGNVTPGVAENKIQFNVHLEENTNQQLIPNQTVSLKVLKSMRENVLRIKSSNKIKANTEQTVYVIDNLGNKVSRTVNFGIKGVDFQEVISGLSEGERVVLSDTPFSWGTKRNSVK